MKLTPAMKATQKPKPRTHGVAAEPEADVEYYLDAINSDV